MRLPKVRKGGRPVNAAGNGEKQRPAPTKALELMCTQGRQEEIL